MNSVVFGKLAAERQGDSTWPGKLRDACCGIAEPVLAREPLLIRLCSAFVNNLTLILRVALVMGTVLLVQDLRSLREELSQSVAEIEPAPAVNPVETEPTAEPQEPVLSKRVKHFLNCTYEDYRTAHYNECVDEPSRIYLGPREEPDDMGNVTYDGPVRLVRLDGYASTQQLR